ncbi:DNA-directed RNA polymerase III subunit RPC8 [Cyanidiococcus yangmingshanensis]|uniref:DNA-directed RNA polymerase III subunit RPC8 n=1 Tax=Cyanidiococcus yangmingshanensis TaxID=2690220 RepID=A0A7J7INF2_9RHOD|nr:DNA-directed RNA polymerase III subunit RPC8 [Cyanidiococcus yangmingshanensis]
MFRSVLVEALIRVDAPLLAHCLDDALLHACKQRFCSRILPGLGICLTVLRISKLLSGPGKQLPLEVCPGEATGGGLRARVQAELLVWSPLPHEIAFAQVRSCSRFGVRLSILNGFDYVFVPPGNMPEPCTHLEEKRCWSWRFEENDFIIREGDWVRVLIDHVEYATDNAFESVLDRRSGSGPPLHILPPPAPIGRSTPETDSELGAALSNGTFLVQPTPLETEPVEFWESPHVLPMRVWARMDADGLGPIDWWC